MSGDLSTKCRTCLSDANFFHQLFDYVDERHKILEMLDNIVPQINIKCTKKLSNLVCQPCVDKLLTGYKFQQLCIETNNRLHDLLGIAVFGREPKLENALDPLTEETNLKMEQEIEDEVCYEQELNPDELEVSMRSDNEGDWRPTTSRGSESQETLTFQCPDCFKCFKKRTSLSAHYKVHREKHDDKIFYKGIRVNTSTKVDEIETQETEEDNEPTLCIKEEYEKSPQIANECMDETETNGELFNNDNQDSGDEADKDLLVKPVKSTKDVDAIDNGLAKVKKTESKSTNIKIKNKASSLADNKVQREKHDSKLVDEDKAHKIDTQETENNITNEPVVCAKKELEIAPEIHEEPIDELDCEMFSNDSDYSNEESDEDLLEIPVKDSNEIDFLDTGLAKMKKSIGSNKKRGNFPCEVCGKVFDRLFSLQRHSAIHFDNETNVDFDTDTGEIEKPKNYSCNYACEVCGRKFGSTFVLKRHVRVHSPSRPFECEICKYRFVTSAALKGHLFQHENGTFDNWKTYSRPDGFKCPDCPRRFEKRASLSSHRRIHTYNFSNYPCILCQKFFTTLRGLTLHMLEKHPDLEKHKCDQCKKTFVLHAILVQHLNRHKGNNNVVCLICEEEFVNNNDLSEHMRTHSSYANTAIDQIRLKPSNEGLHLCPQCGKTFTKDDYLQKHLPRHSELKKYQCSECPKRFNCKSDFIRHIATHTNDKPHSCNICGSSFTRASSLRKHKLVKHSDERPFKCDQCTMTFAIADKLKIHMRTHTGEKPYKCKYCERAYAQKGDLTKHLRTHIGENTYMCDECPMAFKYHAELKQHQSEHYKMAQKLLQQSKQMPEESKQQQENK